MIASRIVSLYTIHSVKVSFFIKNQSIIFSITLFSIVVSIISTVFIPIVVSLCIGSNSFSLYYQGLWKFTQEAIAPPFLFPAMQNSNRKKMETKGPVSLSTSMSSVQKEKDFIEKFHPLATYCLNMKATSFGFTLLIST